MAKVEADYIWFNGKLMPWQDAKIHVMSHSLHYGSSVFEGVRCYETINGPAIFRHNEHVQRLYNSAKVYRLNIPYTQEEIKQGTKDLLLKNNLRKAYIRPLVFLGDIGMGVNPPKDAVADVMVAAFPWEAYLGEEAIENGVRVCVSSWTRFAPNTIPSGAKAGGNYLSSMLIGEEARRNGFVEGLSLDINGCVSEGSGENIFLISKGIVYTPSLTSSVLPGITRDSIICLARDLGLEVIEQAISRESLYFADEVFMTGTAAEITPISSVDDIIVGNGKRGTITKQIQQAFWGLFNGTTEDIYGWLDYIS